ncbi:MAG: hypothetical protein GY798_16695 [Hyphomicrobiales bacterium]|nr:hypothetical protein [Hyphomicrobiales bacterium]
MKGYALVGGDESDPTCEIAVSFKRCRQMLDAAIFTVLFRDRLTEARDIGATLVAVAASNETSSDFSRPEATFSSKAQPAVLRQQGLGRRLRARAWSITKSASIPFPSGKEHTLFLKTL